MESYNQSICHNCLTHGCRGHNCNADDRDIHEAIPNVMAVLHENLELQQGLLDAAEMLLLQPSSHPSHSVLIFLWLATPTSIPMLTIRTQQSNGTAT